MVQKGIFRFSIGMICLAVEGFFFLESSGLDAKTKHDACQEYGARAVSGGQLLIVIKQCLRTCAECADRAFIRGLAIPFSPPQNIQNSVTNLKAHISGFFSHRIQLSSMISKSCKFIIAFLVMTTSASPTSPLAFRDTSNCNEQCTKEGLIFCCGSQGFRCTGGNLQVLFKCTVQGEVCIITPEGIGCGYSG